MANTWGESGSTWSQGDWGQQNVTTVPVSTSFPVPVSYNSSEVIGSPDRGWGADAWSNGEWGQVNDDTAYLTGLSFSSSVGSITAASEQGWGRDTYGNEPWGDSYSPVISVSGFSFSAS